MKEVPKRVIVRFFRTDSGNEPVRKWLKSLAPEDRRVSVQIYKHLNLAGLSVCLYAAR